MHIKYIMSVFLWLIVYVFMYWVYILCILCIIYVFLYNSYYLCMHLMYFLFIHFSYFKDVLPSLWIDRYGILLSILLYYQTKSYLRVGAIEDLADFLYW